MPAKYEVVPCNRVLDTYGIFGTRLWTRHCFDPYVNCEFNCVYCSSPLINREGFPDATAPVYVRLNAPQILDKELSCVKRRGVVNLGVMADIYQPAEEKYQVTRQLLQVLKKHKCPFAIGTKSDLVIRDIDIIAEAAKKTWVCTSISITTLDETLAKKLDPNAPSPKRRLAALKRLADAGVMTGIWMTPVIPCITDSYQNMEAVIEAAVANGAKFVLGGGLDMRDPSRVRRFMVENYPEVVPKFDRLFHWTDKPHTHYPDEAYLYDLTKKFIVICQKAGVESFSPHLYNRRQAWLFYVRNFGQFKGTPLFELTQIINYLTPPKEMFQRLNITAGRNSVCKGFLKTMRYLPH